MSAGFDADAQADLETAIWRWVDEAVIGLNLCPFAASPRRRHQVRLVILETNDEQAVLASMQDELAHLDSHSAQEVDTTLLAVPGLWLDFLDFNDFLEQADALLSKLGRVGVYQLASFHPAYQFADTQPGDVANLVHAAPCPIVHILREDSLSVAVDRHPDPEAIPEHNERRLAALSEAERHRIFPWVRSRQS